MSRNNTEKKKNMVTCWSYLHYFTSKSHAPTGSNERFSKKITNSDLINGIVQ